MKRDRDSRMQKNNLSFKKENLTKIMSTRQWLIVFFGLLICSSLFLHAIVTVRVQAASRTISGTVFQDFNGNGTFETGQTLANSSGTGTIGIAVDRGVQGVTVTAYDTTGAAQPAATTAANGTYTITTNSGSVGPYRIEFTNLPAGYYPSARSTDSVNGGTSTNAGTTVQFITDANTTNVNLAINRPVDYSENNPLLATSLYNFGHRTDTGSTNVLSSFPYIAGSNSTTNVAGYISPTQSSEATKTQIGSVFGLAYRRVSDTLYASAYMKRHTGVGPSGTGAIYQISNVSNTTAGTPSLFATIPNAGNDTHPTVTGAGVAWENDYSTFDAIGKIGLGGLDVSDDGSALFTINLNTRELYQIPISTALPVSRGVVPNPGCTNGVGRPFAVKYANGLVYVGGVCTAENAGGTAANLRAYVYTFNPSTNTYSASPVLNFALNYTRGCVDDAQPCHNGEENAEWRPWVSTLNFDTVDADNDTQVAYPQAMLTDIDFIGTDMVLAFRDRIGDQGGNGTRNPANTSDGADYVTNTAGEILRANSNGTNSWALESNSQSNPTGTFGPTTGQNNQEGPNGGEFYYGEDHPYHDEVVNGGVAYIGGFPDVVVTAMDPARMESATWDGGTRWLSNTNGSYTKGYIIYDGQRLDNLFGKAGGVGEVEGMSRRAPIELGSRVWRDSDNDGVQDPVNGTTEPGIQSITVRLYRPGFGPDGVAGNGDDATALAVAVTDANGEYYFTSGTAADGNTTDNIGIYNGSILPNTAYEIRIDNNANFQSGGALFVGSAALNLTAPNATAQSGDDDASDSDGLYDANTSCAATNNRCPTISFTTEVSGANDHTLDFGFTTNTTYTPTSTTYSVGNRVWFDTDNDNVRDTTGTAEVGVANVSVSIFADADNNGTPESINAPLQTVWTSASGYYRFDGLLAGNYVVRVDPQNFEVGSVLAGYQNTTGTEADPDSAGDTNDNGINPANSNNPQTSVNGILSGALTLGTGLQPTGETDLGPGDSALTDNLVDLTVDFSFYRLNLSGTAWRDNNNNGLITAGELGLRNIRIRVYDSAGTTELPIGPDGILGSSDDSPGGVATNAVGDYAVTGVVAGNYVMKATLPASATSSTGTGYEPGPNPNNEVDSDDNGTNGSGANAGLMVSMAKTMTPGGQTVVVNATGTTSNPTVDFGIIFAPSAVELIEFKAYQENSHVLLQWESGFEVDNLGYNIIRESNGKREIVNSSMIAGSALQVGQGTVLTAGNTYRWTEELSPKDIESGVQYWLEAIDIDGTSKAYGPYIPEHTMPESETAQRTRTLSELGRDVSNLQSQREYPALLSPQVESVKADNTSSRTSKGTQRDDWAVARETAAKITVRSDGWYRITREQLSAVGFNSYTYSSRWQLFANGKEKAMKINQDGSIEFYGKALDTRSTDGQVYWLYSGKFNGLRIAQSSSNGTSADAPSTFMQTVERRDRVIRFSAILNGEEDNFFGPPINTSGEVNQTLAINKLENQQGGTVAIEVGLQGMTLQEHLVEVRLNGEVLGTINYLDREKTSMMFNLPAAGLPEGNNVVSLISRNAGSDVSLLDFIRVTYPRKAEAVDDYLEFSVNAREGMTVAGFTTDNLRVFDITNVAAPIEVSVNTERGSYGYGFSLLPTADSRRYMAFVAGQEKAATELSINNVSDLRNTANKADFLIITHKDLMKAADLLREKRQSQGLNTLVVDVQDIYDEFDYGTHGSNAVQKFLNYALTKWNGKPAYVLLLGDASYDPRNYTTIGGPAADLVPTYMVDTDFMETASDELLADVNGDGVAEASIGRLPVRNEEEATIVVNKLLNYEKPDIRTKKDRAGVIVSDFASDIDFASESKQTSLQLPADMKVEFINRSDADVNDVREQIRTAINAGPTVVNFMGHGTLTSWTNAVLLRSTDAMNLQNRDNLSLVVMMSCLNGSFGEIGIDSMAEAWVKAPNGGAVAVWASSGMSAPDQQALLNRYFYQSLFGNRNVAFGDAVRAAKQSVNDQNVRRTWIFFGDPTMQVR